VVKRTTVGSTQCTRKDRNKRSPWPEGGRPRRIPAPSTTSRHTRRSGSHGRPSGPGGVHGKDIRGDDDRVHSGKPQKRGGTKTCHFTMPKQQFVQKRRAVARVQNQQHHVALVCMQFALSPVFNNRPYRKPSHWYRKVVLGPVHGQVNMQQQFGILDHWPLTGLTTQSQCNTETRRNAGSQCRTLNATIVCTAARHETPRIVPCVRKQEGS